MPSKLYEIDLAACRARQQRLLAVMERLDLDLAIVTQLEHVQWLTGVRFGWVFAPCAALARDGHVTLVAPGTLPDVAAADEVATYEAQWLCTLRNDQRQASSAVLVEAITARGNSRSGGPSRGAGPTKVGIEFSSCPQHLTAALKAEVVDIEPELYRLRRNKDPDELARIRKAIAGTEAMYRRGREVIEPGVSELVVFSQLQAAVVKEFGEINPALGNDWACGERGGPPRNRRIEDGELYILDLGPCYRGYYADNCRTIAVGQRPSDEQLEAWERIVNIFTLVERSVRPGKSCREFYEEVQAQLEAARPLVFDHHLGHGIGLFPHETPHLNPLWDDTFEEGDVFACEPGLYGPSLRAGIRLENNYRVTESGVDLLSDFALTL